MENGHYSTRTMGNGSIPTQHASELQSLHRTVQQLEDRCLLLENIAQEQEDRLEKQEEARIEKDRAMKKTCETYEQTIKEYGDKISDMMLHIRTRDRQILAVEDKMRRAQRDLQHYHKKKHEIVEQAKKQEREAIRDRERAALDIRHMSSSGSYSGAANGGTGEPRGDLGRRTPSSGSFFARVAAGAGAGVGVGNGAPGAEPGGGGGERGGGACCAAGSNPENLL
eukprot:jgi/Undpi1/9061/HiC_scaffold_26.g11521.m1